MKTIARCFAMLGLMWVGFWLRISDPEMYRQLSEAMDDDFSKYP